jgi:hypothetical protein
MSPSNAVWRGGMAALDESNNLPLVRVDRLRPPDDPCISDLHRTAPLVPTIRPPYSYSGSLYIR